MVQKGHLKKPAYFPEMPAANLQKAEQLLGKFGKNWVLVSVSSLGTPRNSPLWTECMLDHFLPDVRMYLSCLRLAGFHACSCNSHFYMKEAITGAYVQLIQSVS
jgi:hypothetical protein